MHWGNVNFLLLLWLLPLVGYLLVRSYRKVGAAAHVFASAVMAPRLMPPRVGGRAWLKGTAVLAALAALIVGGARPQFGAYLETVTQRGVDLFVLLDVSRSMLANDVAPSRLERAKLDIADLLQRIPGDRAGLIVFAGQSVMQVPLTTDHNYYRMVLNDVDTTSAPRGGTMIGDAIRKAMQSLPERGERDQVLVLITDGDDQDSFPQEAAGQAAERGIKIFTVGMGDPGEGSRIPTRDKSGALSYLQHKGQEVWSKMNEPLLREVALSTGGDYIPAKTTVYDLGQVYEDHLADLTRGDIRSEKRTRYREQFQLFLAIGVALLLLDFSIAVYSRTTGR